MVKASSLSGSTGGSAMNRSSSMLPRTPNLETMTTASGFSNSVNSVGHSMLQTTNSGHFNHTNNGNSNSSNNLSNGSGAGSNMAPSSMGGGLIDHSPSEDRSAATLAMREKQLEDEVMGNVSSKGHEKSHGMEKNLGQMVKVLNSRLKALENAANLRMRLCEEDLNASSSRTSKDAPKIVDEFEENIPKSLREMKRPDASQALDNGTGNGNAANNNNGNTSNGNKDSQTNNSANGNTATNLATADTTTTSNTSSSSNNNNPTSFVGHAKDNLVSSDTIYIDPYHLVLKTRAPTETAKKLEAHLEDMHGSSALRDMKSKKGKSALAQNDKAKVSEQRKNEAKKIIRQKIEKKLQLTMENFVTRSVMDNDLVFVAPETVNIEAVWPVSIKWCARDPRSSIAENAEGEFDPDLLLRYGMERMHLPSGRKLFVWLIRQAMIQRYFVYLFWLIKIKFFEGENIGQQEAYLMRLIAIEYRSIIEMLGIRAHAEHEKDFVFRFLPFIFTSAAYYGFYYVFPGSRHIYTKGFKKTIYMQVIQVMHGIQVCPLAVRVVWAKVFPEDAHDDAEDGEDVEVFPVPIAIKKPPPAPVVVRAPQRKTKAKSGKVQLPSLRETSSAGSLSRSQSVSQSLSRSQSQVMNNTSGKKQGTLAKDDDDDLTNDEEDNEDDLVDEEYEDDDDDGNGEDQSGSGSRLHRKSKSSLPGSRGGKQHGNSGNDDDNQSYNSTKSQTSFFPGASKEGYIRAQDNLRSAELLQNPSTHHPLTRTYLKAALEKPVNAPVKIKRQNQVERINAEDISPQMAFFLSSMRSAVSEKSTGARTIRRTVPVNWCPAGGSDTHHRVVIQTQLHDEIAQKLVQSQQEYVDETRRFHAMKLDGVKDVKDTLQRVMSSGQTNISRYSLDLIRRQRALRAKETGAAVSSEGLKPEEELDIDALNQLAAREIDIEEVLNL